MPLIFGYSCAKMVAKKERVEAKPSWFDVPDRFTSRDDKEIPPIHSFFDLVPFTKIDDKEINFVPTTPKGSEYRYDIDLQSGRIFLSDNYCAQKDIWKNFKGELKLPNYTEGFIPRLLDQRGMPQKVIAFGDFQPFSYEGRFSERIRIVGGILEQYCEIYPCRTNSEWKSRLVLIAINPNDSKFENVKSLADLKKVENWNYAKAFLENSNGVTVRGDEFFPAFRYTGEIPAEEALSFAVTNGYLFEYKEMMKTRNSCMVLYDYIWNSVAQIREDEEKRKKAISERPRIISNLVKESKDIFSGNVISSEVYQNNQLKEEAKNLRSFPRFFSVFKEKYGQRFKTCTNFVKTSDLTYSIERFWFMQYLSAFIKLEDAGFSYRCNRRAWVENPIRHDGTREFDGLEEIKRCSAKDLDNAFDSAIIVLTGLNRSNGQSHRFIEYDSGVGGSRQRLFSWVFDNGKRNTCSKQVNVERSVFPNDISWKEFSDNEEERRGLIR